MLMFLKEWKVARQTNSLTILRSCDSYRICMAKRTAALWLESELYERLQRIATVDRRSMSQVIAMAIGHGLPALEEELSHKLESGTKPPTPVATPVEQAALAAGLAASEVVQKRRKRGGAQAP